MYLVLFLVSLFSSLLILHNIFNSVYTIVVTLSYNVLWVSLLLDNKAVSSLS
ncbi:hypothetical protein BCN_P239 (plasmid) [Bacillus cereus NC7401]|nr:hypothetical protein BCN_P239 [Bacillus cereus NC7401]